MRSEIDKNHLQVQLVKTNNPRTVVENSAHEINLSLTDVRREGQTLSFVVNRVNVYELKSWLREINQTSGVTLQKINLTPVDHLSDVKAQVQLTGQKAHEYLHADAGGLSARFPDDECYPGGIMGSFLGVVAERVPGMVMDEEGAAICSFLPRTARCVSTRLLHGKISRCSVGCYYGGAVTSAAARSRCDSFGGTVLRAVFGITARCMPDVQALFSLWLLAAFYCRWP